MTGVTRPSTRTVVALLCLAAVALAAGSPAAASPGITIEEDSVEQTDGDIAEFTLSVPAGENVTVVVEGNSSYRRQLHLGDATGDGQITLSVNSYLAKQDTETSRVYTVGGDDTLSADANETDGHLSAGSYRITAYDNGTGDAPTDTATLSLTEPGLANATVMIAPNGVADRLTSRSAIRQARQDGTVRRSTNVVRGDTFIFRMTAPGIGGAVAAENGSSQNEKFLAFLDRPGVELNLTDRNPEPSREPSQLTLDSTTVSSAVADPENDIYYVIVDLPFDVSLHYEDRETPTEEFVYYPHEDRVVPRLVVDGHHRLNPGDVRSGSKTGQFTLCRQDMEFFVDSEWTVQPSFTAEPNQTVRIATNFAPGTAVTVSVTNASGVDGPIDVTRRVPAWSNSTAIDGERVSVFTATFDLTEVDPGTEVGLAVSTDESLVWGPFQVPVDDGSASIDLSADPLDNGTVHVENATLPHGGFVVVKSADRELTLAESDYLEPGSHEDLRLRFGEASPDRDDTEIHVVLAHDSDGNGRYSDDEERGIDRLYADNRSAVGVTVGAENDEERPAETPRATTTSTTTEPTDTPPTTPTAPTPASTTETGTTAPIASSSATPDQSTAMPTQTTAGDGPGFGAVAAIVGVLGGLVVAMRYRRDP